MPLAGQLELPLFAPPPALPSVRSIALNGERVSYSLRRAAGRRRIVITVDESGVRVSAPVRATLGEIERVLVKHADWVLRMQAQWAARARAPRRWRGGESICYLGRSIALAAAAVFEPRLAADRLEIPATALAPAIETAVRRWLEIEALATFRDRTTGFAAVLGLPSPPVGLSSARTRWGSCSADGSILLNWRLVQAPMELIDYVVAHEVAHLRELNHSPRFWQVVAQLVPDWKLRRERLRREVYRYLVL